MARQVGNRIYVKGSVHDSEFNVLDESSLSRIIKHCKNGFFAISACRGEREVPNEDLSVEQMASYNHKKLKAIPKEDRKIVDSSDNEEINRIWTGRLEKKIRSNGLGFITTWGGYPETADDGSVRFVDDEVSKFVPYKADVMSWDAFVKLAVELASEFDQDSVAIGEPVEGEDLLNVALWAHPSETDWNYSKSDSFQWRNIEFPDVPNIMRRLEKGEMVFYSRLKKGAHRNKKFEYEGKRVLGYLAPSSYTAKRLAAMSGEILFNQLPIPGSKPFVASEAVDRILDGESVKSVLG